MHPTVYVLEKAVTYEGKHLVGLFVSQRLARSFTVKQIEEDGGEPITGRGIVRDSRSETEQYHITPWVVQG